MQDSHPLPRCPRCKGVPLPYHAYCRECKALYARELREADKEANAEEAERHSRYFDGIDEETLP